MAQSKIIMPLVVVVIVAVAIVGTYYAVSPAVSVEPEKLKVAFCLPGYLTDASYNAAMYIAAYELADEMDLDIAISEGMGWGSIDSTLIYYANEGYDVIFAHTEGYQASALRVAPDYPDTWFVVNAGWQFAPNVIGYTTRGYEGAYLAGILSASVSQTGIIGSINGDDFEILRVNTNGYIQGAQSVNPDIKVLVSFAGGAWADITKGTELALAQIDSGADVIYSQGDGLTIGAIAACKSRNTPEHPVYAIGYVSDQNSLAWDTVLSSGLCDYKIITRDIIEMYREGTLEGNRNYYYGIKENVHKLAPFHGLDDVVPQETKDAIDQVIEDVTAGTLEIPWIGDYIIET